MSKLTKILISATTAIIALGGFASVAFAQVAPLNVQFENEPLFSVSNFMPGDSRDADIIVGNNDTILHSAYIEAVNVSNGDNLASQMRLEMFDGSTSIYDNNFETFLNAGPVSLSPIAGNSSKTFNLKITFIESANNDYQGKTLGFDICVGFSGGNQTCTNTTSVGPEQNPSDNPSTGGGSSGGGGGGTSGSQHLIIFNEQALNISANGVIPGSGLATISWNTNIPATSQVVYGLASNAPYSFDINDLPSFGYTFVNVENPAKTVNHSMLLMGLSPGETYVYRVVSRASPATISYEHEFTVPTPSGSGNTITSGSLGISAGEVLGADTENEDASADGETAGILNKENLAAAVTAGWGDLISRCSLLALLILLVAYIIWRFILRPRYERKGLLREEVKRKSYAFFGLFSGLATVVAFVLGQYCPIPIFIIALLLSLGLYVYNIVK